ncbi:hypothetical protein FOA52_006231 [Chlamydomonas sp. UWO 241]|nr:hypothetical protein FOA52_006231 [Chlamydomonas sp. UWO 241]
MPPVPDLASRGRKAGAFKVVDSLLSSDAPLDEADQDGLVAEFEAINIQQARTWTSVFGGLELALACVYAGSAVSQTAHPWELKYVAGVRPALSHTEVLLLLTLQVCVCVCVRPNLPVPSHAEVLLLLTLQALALLVCAGATLATLPMGKAARGGCVPSPVRARVALWACVVLSAAIGALWGWRLLQLRVPGAGLDPALAWVPLAPFVLCAVCASLVASLDASAREVAALGALRYHHKAL